ncbi:unnamed protein product [Miscanthus lutarioriparius]|uniref:ATPase AAA-type core domain-containing protein n=1 Tax=Miscanthus lutarioriparius TaxID=422564 RepID=A0A811QAL9_9POAL|nr:unnamed protein product [Miscanthus lutarioriparius]
MVCLDHASKLKAELGNNSKDDPLIGLDKNQEVVDNFDGARMWWRLCPKSAKNRGPTVIACCTGIPTMSLGATGWCFTSATANLCSTPTCPKIVRQWARDNRHEPAERLLFTNHSQEGKSRWINVPYNPPATFDMLAMDHSKKIEIMEDLTAFREAASTTPRSARRGSGIPPAWTAGHEQVHHDRAMANFLEYDVYDLDLTSIKDNAELRKLFLDTTDRSIIVIEDIDAIEVELTTKRKGKEAAKENDDNHLVIELSEKNNKGKVTLSGLLSFVDGLWSACGSERIFVFTTNHVDRLDPALIRRGRMDRHIEMSYCRFEAFKMLAKSYLDITEHSLFGEIGQLLDEIDTTPADVADNLMPRGKRNGEIDRLLDEMNGAPADVAGNLMLRVKRREADDCLAGLVETLKKAKMKAAAPPMDSVEEAKEE